MSGFKRSTKRLGVTFSTSPSTGLTNFSLTSMKPYALATPLALLLALPVSAQNWQPSKPITIIVPWAAGGSTDQVTRVTAAEIEKVLNQKIVIQNQPGASGSVGT